MELSKQVTSLEISQRLKALGVEQKSLFVWQSPTGDTQNRDAVLILREKMKRFIYISAFTTSELGEMLKDSGWVLPTYNAQYTGEEWGAGILRAANEADCRGKILIYLLEQGLLKK